MLTAGKHVVVKAVRRLLELVRPERILRDGLAPLRTRFIGTFLQHRFLTTAWANRQFVDASTGFVVGPTNYAPEHLLPQ